MQLPKELEVLRDRKIWLCYPMIWNKTKHNGVGGYDKPPINAYTLKNGSSDNPDHLSDYDTAAARIGQTAFVNSKNYRGNVEIVGVGIALSGTGICGIDMDNVADSKREMLTVEADKIINAIDSYTEISPSGEGVHILFYGELPKGIKKTAKPKPDIFHTEKGEYQLFDSGYMTISGNSIRGKVIAERTDRIRDVYEQFFRIEEKDAGQDPGQDQGQASSVGSCSPREGVTFDRWLQEIKHLSDFELMDQIYSSSTIGKKVRALYNGDISDYDNDHSRADQALINYLYGFTHDRYTTERLFRNSSLYRETGKSRNYIRHSIDKAVEKPLQLIGHIIWTDEEKKVYAQKKQAAEDERQAKSFYDRFFNKTTEKKRNNDNNGFYDKFK